jgi:hypothetical protein
MVMLLVESIDINTIWNPVIDMVNESMEGNTTTKSEPIEGKDHK